MTREDPGRAYDGDEVAAILRAAAEIDQRRSSSASLPARRGMTLAEVQQIAGEVGISPDAVVAAARRVPTPAPLSHRFQQTHTVVGEVPDGRMVQLEDELRAVVGPRGNVRRIAGGLEIDVEKSDLGSLRIVVRSGGGATTATLWSERSRGTESALVGSSLGLLGGLGLAANAPGAAAMAVAGVAGMGALLVAGAGVGLGVGLGIWRLTSVRWRTRVVDLLLEITRRVEAAVEPLPANGQANDAAGAPPRSAPTLPHG
ncbi:MAG TPA: hypothetical protein VFZ18_01170 [Longimicrobiaceae bacterium]